MTKNQTEKSLYDEVEREGREWLSARAKEEREKAARFTHPRFRRAWERHEARANKFVLQEVSKTRSLWRIDITGWGEMFWVGTYASAVGRRVLKHRHEGAPSSRVERVGPAPRKAPNGDAERPGNLPAEQPDAKGRVYFHTPFDCLGLLHCDKTCGGAWVHVS